MPVEAEHRELDAKFLLALRILESSKDAEVVVGYDKHITNILLRTKSPSILLDKSCSNIMYAGRIKSVLEAKGKVAVCDEEGVNNITNNWSGLITRFDPRSVLGISKYFCWGPLDKKLASEAGIDPSKIFVTGNPRLDMLSERGKKYYKREIKAYKEFFGDFVLINDNFVIEHFDSSYQPPLRQHLSEIETQALIKNRLERKKIASEERMALVKVVKKVAKVHPDKNFVLRPHPISNPSFWMTEFSRCRNVFVIYKGSIEPWLFSCEALISSGCTTALQAALAKVPIFHFQTAGSTHSNSLSAELGILFNENSLEQKYLNNQISLNYNKAIQSLTCNPSPSYAIASELASMSDHTTRVKYVIDKSCINRWNSVNPTSKNMRLEPKWLQRGYNMQELSSKVRKLMESFNIQVNSLAIKKVSKTLFILSNVS